MRRKGLWLSVLATAMIAGSASAATIASSWGFDWGTYTGANGIEWRHDLFNSAYDNVAGVDDLDPTLAHPEWLDTQTPGDGGQNYDAEELIYRYNAGQNALYVALITGFNPYGEVGDSAGSPYYAGDLFIDLGASGSYTIAVGMGLGTGSRSGAWAGPIASGDLIPVSHTVAPHDHTIAQPYRVTDNFINNAPNDLSAGLDIHHTRLWTNFASPTGPQPVGGNYNSERWLYEFRLILDPLGQGAIDALTAQGGGIGLNWTMGCGNDYIRVFDDTPLAPVPVPAAAPLGLLGMGLLALVRRVRRRTEC